MDMNIMLVDDCVDAITRNEKRLTLSSKLPELNHVRFDVVKYLNPEDALASKKKFHFAFIDVEMPQMDGFELAAKLNEKQPECLIIFLTDHLGPFRKSYGLRTYDYLLKSDSQEVFNDLIIRAVNEFKSYGTIMVTSKSGVVELTQEDILYAEVFGNGSTIYGADGKIYESQINLKKLEELLSKNLFFRCHTSFMVNLKYYDGWDEAEKVIFLSSELVKKKVGVSARNISKVKPAILNYRRKRGEG